MDPVIEKYLSIALVLFSFIILTWKQIGEKLLFWGRSDLRNVDEELDELDATELDENFPFKSLPTDGPNPKLTIFYGTQTGTAQDLAQQLAKQAYDHNFQTRVIDIALVDPTWIKQEQLVCFVLSTYGEGEPTDSAKTFTDWIDQDHNVFELGGVQYFVFGLGDSSYSHFNAVAVKYDKRLSEIGASRVFPLAKGDAHGCLEEDFMEWSSKLLPHLVDTFSIELTEDQLRGTSAPQLFTTILNKSPEAIHLPIPGSENLPDIIKSNGKLIPGKDSFFSQKNPYISSIITHQELHSTKSDRSCLHIEFQLPSPKTDPVAHSHLLYSAGDHLGVFPVNKTEWVAEAASYLGFSDSVLDTVFTCEATQANSFVIHPPYPSPTTFRDALTHYLDIQAVPKKKMLRILADYAHKTNEKEKLLLLSSLSVQGKKKYHEEIINGGRTLWDVLDMFSSIKIPSDSLYDLLPPLVPRYYSISSSQSFQPDRVSITSVLVDYISSATAKHRQGVCTSFLARSQVGSKVRIFLRASSFRLPEDKSSPIIMVGPGTGIAPFRGFLQERLLGSVSVTPSPSGSSSSSSRPKLFSRNKNKNKNKNPQVVPLETIFEPKQCQNLPNSRKAQQTQNNLQLQATNASPSNSSVQLIADDVTDISGKNFVFFGCRHPDIDYLYQNTLETLSKDDNIKLFNAFSRLSSNKVYVQHLLANQSSLIWNLLKSGASIYICGEASGMSQDVRLAIEKVVQTEGGLTEEQTQEYIENLFATKRYQMDVW